ncbi:MAG TPA: (Fe-S)-binding protein [Dehalococcoidales bacterium]|nr:(Fe-S)-binding protein [Dehalococcoidales bacterium]
MALNDVKEWLYGCSRCGTCKDILNIFVPACPSGEMYQLESYYPSGKIAVARAVSEGKLPLDNDDTRERIYACTGCLSCEQQCGVYHHQHIFEIIQAVRTEAVGQGLLNPAYMVMVESLKKDDNVFGKPKAERGDWARDLDLKDAGQEKVATVYHAGCMLSFDRELWNVPRSAVALLKAAGVDVGIMGAGESCCGGRAYEIGYVGEFTKYAEHFLETFNSLGAGRVVTSCSDGYSTFRKLYPGVNIEMKFEVRHTVEYLDELIKGGKLKLTKKVPMKVTYHDPCHLGRHLGDDGIYDAPREVLKAVPGLELVEMERHRENAWCCGAGAGVSQANPEFALWTAGERLKEARATGAGALVTSCPWCERNFKDAAKEYGQDIEIYDIAEVACRAL